MSAVIYHPAPLSTADNGTYQAVSPDNHLWTYSYTIRLAGTKSEQRIGELAYDKKDVVADIAGVHLETPWGLLHAYSMHYSRGWLVEGAHGAPPTPPDSPVISGPPISLNGVWTSKLTRWEYSVEISGATTKSETRKGQIFRNGEPVKGAQDGETLRTPWGLCRWCAKSEYELGWLFFGCYDRK